MSLISSAVGWRKLADIPLFRRCYAAVFALLFAPVFGRNITIIQIVGGSSCENLENSETGIGDRG
jgi:hypothetical protein